MVNLDNANEVASKASDVAHHGAGPLSNIDLTETLKTAIAAEPFKFLTVFVFIFGFLVFVYVLKALVKFIDVKFINTKMAEFKVVSDVVTTSNTEHVDAIRKISTDNIKSLYDIQNSIRDDFHKQKDQWRVVDENITLKVKKLETKIDSLAAKVEGLPSVSDAVAEYQKKTDPRITNLEDNFKKNIANAIVSVAEKLNEKKGGKNGV